MKNDITRDILPASWNMIKFVTFVITVVTQEHIILKEKQIYVDYMDKDWGSVHNQK